MTSKTPVDTSTLFSDKSELYQRSRPTYPPELYQFLAEQCLNHDHAWDCATGNGQAARHLIKHFAKITASDISAQQIAEAIPHPSIRYIQSGAEHTPLANNSVDLVTVAQALHWFDYQQFWPEVARVLRPGGVFAAWGYNWPRWGEQFDKVLTESFLRVIHPYFSANNQLLWDGYRDVIFPFTPIDSPKFSMTVQYTLDQLFDFLHSVSATRRCIEHQGDDFFHQAYQATAQIWGNPNLNREFEIDLVLLVGKR
ncbi:class I SAM-dependent methyltransferase [Arenicella xantha]|uniref:Methyltransferase family protein n=1 Tax=Arenicella xantha TaxID=644221 RepID=A0A395JHY9_9GAMM|nr:class I SAM-dependent methyltransferase [Arenicella xantha]RBP48340.1 methyltransferase family protein [Arenicella xantha]